MIEDDVAEIIEKVVKWSLAAFLATVFLLLVFSLLT